jgi:hypothetical protein
VEYIGPKSEEVRMGGSCGTYRGDEKYYRVLAGKPEGKGPLGRPRHRWVHNMKMALTEIVWKGVDWIALDQDRSSGCCKHGHEPLRCVPYNVANFLTSCIQVNPIGSTHKARYTACM